TRVGHDRLLLVPLSGGGPVDLAAALDRNVMPGAPGYPGGLPQVTADGRTVLFCVRDRGCSHVYAVDLPAVDVADPSVVDFGAGDHRPRPVVAGADRVVSGLSVARAANRAAVVVAGPTSYGGGVVGDVGAAGRARGAVRTGHWPAGRALGGGDRRRGPAVAGAARVVSGLSVARAANRAAVVVAGPTSYGEVVLVDLDAAGPARESVLTGHSPADLDLVVPEERTFTVSD